MDKLKNPLSSYVSLFLYWKLRIFVVHTISSMFVYGIWVVLVYGVDYYCHCTLQFVTKLRLSVSNSKRR